MRRMLRKICAYVMSAALVVSILPSVVFAEDSSGLEAAILSAKSRIEVAEELTEFYSSVSTLEDRTQYDLNWSDKDDNNRLTVTVNDRDDITFYSRFSNSDYERKIKFANFSNEQLLDVAYEWLAQVNPDWIAELPREKVVANDKSDIYSGIEYLTILRYVNGIPYMGDSVSLSMDNRTGNVRNMYASWTYETDIPDPSEAMSEEAAAEEFFKLSPLELCYVRDSENAAVLVYEPTNSYVNINARFGGENNEDRNGSFAMKEEAAMDAAVSSSAAGASRAQLTESEINNLNEIEGLIPRAELEKKARTLYNTGLDKAVFESCEYRRSYVYMPFSGVEDDKEERYTASLSFVIDKDTENQSTGNAEFDAKTGELISYYSWDRGGYYDSYGEENKKPAVGVTAAEQTAMRFAEQNAPEAAAKTKVKDMPEENYGSDYFFNFVRFENDIPFYENGIYIDVDSDSGLVRSFRKSWDDEITFEGTDGIMDIEEAKAAFCRNIEFMLSYKYNYIEADKRSVVELTYNAVSERGFAMNAKTGEHRFDPYTAEEIIYPDDISGHYAEDRIKSLIDVGMLQMDKETSFRPDDAVTHGELAVMVGRLINSYYGPVAKADMASIVRGWGIVLRDEAFDADETATRLYGPKYIIRALGYREVAELPDTYTCSFADSDMIPEGMLGYIALAKGFGIVGGDENNCINATDVLTRADAAIMIYNYLAR